MGGSGGKTVGGLRGISGWRRQVVGSGWAGGGRWVGGIGASDKCWRPLTAAEYRWFARARLGVERHPCGPGLRGGRDLGQTSILYERD